jgi:integrase
VVKVLDGQLGADREWLLPARGKDGPLRSSALVHELIKLQSGKSPELALPDGHVTGHDLRRTWASTASGLGVEGLVVERQLQHSLRKTGLSAVAGVYLVSDLLDRRYAAVELVDAHWAYRAIAQT